MSDATAYAGKAGDMRDPVRVQRVVYTDDGSGGQVKTWSDYCVVFCATESVNAGERSGDSFPGQVRSVETRVFRTWWRDDIDVENRLFWKGLLWNIRDVDNLSSRNKYMEIIAEKGVEQ